MKIHVMSDLHLEFGRLDQKLPTGDVLILAGDIVPVRYLETRMNDSRSRSIRKSAMALFKEAQDNFNRVFYLTGNHEFYNGNISNDSPMIEEILPGITLLNDTAVDLDDKTILVGGTLWTDMNKGKDAQLVERGMNDFRFIDTWDTEGTQDGFVPAPRRFTTDDAMAMHKRTKAFIAKTAKANIDKRIVVSTHHAPSIQGVDVNRYRHSDINAGYYTDLEKFIQDRPNICAWVHGHTHIQKTYTIAQCRVFSNARGYIGHERSADTFDPDRWIDLDAKPGAAASMLSTAPESPKDGNQDAA